MRFSNIAKWKASLFKSTLLGVLVQEKQENQTKLIRTSVLLAGGADYVRIPRSAVLFLND